MQAVLKTSAISVTEYLAGEQESDVRHEYIGGEVYAMAGSSESHNIIVGNLFTSLRTHLRGKSCRTFVTDMKVRLEIASDDIFYYPDIFVACDSRDTEAFFKRFPKVIIEVLSETTERTDRREKFLSYIQIETLEEYVLVSQERHEITVFRRANQWKPETLKGLESELKLNALEFSTPFSSIYEDVKI